MFSTLDETAFKLNIYKKISFLFLQVLFMRKRHKTIGACKIKIIWQGRNINN